MLDESVGSRLERVRDRVAKAAERSGRDPDSVTLVAVTKGVDAGRIAEAYALGVRDFGESYVQEASAKITGLAEKLSAASWHFIGHLQRNKVALVVGRYALVHSVDSLRLAQEIDRRSALLGLRTPVLLEVRLDSGPTRTGFLPDEAVDAAEQIAALANIEVRGFMGIPPRGETPEAARPHFRRIAALYGELPDTTRRILSMGMTGDFEAAVEEGATHIRVGTALFGARAASI